MPTDLLREDVRCISRSYQRIGRSVVLWDVAFDSGDQSGRAAALCCTSDRGRNARSTAATSAIRERSTKGTG